MFWCCMMSIFRSCSLFLFTSIQESDYIDLHCSSLASRTNDCWVQTEENLGSKFLLLFWKFFSSKNKIEALL